MLTAGESRSRSPRAGRSRATSGAPTRARFAAHSDDADRGRRCACSVKLAGAGEASAARAGVDRSRVQRAPARLCRAYGLAKARRAARATPEVSWCHATQRRRVPATRAHCSRDGVAALAIAVALGLGAVGRAPALSRRHEGRCWTGREDWFAKVRTWHGHSAPPRRRKRRHAPGARRQQDEAGISRASRTNVASRSRSPPVIAERALRAEAPARRRRSAPRTRLTSGLRSPRRRRPRARVETGIRAVPPRDRVALQAAPAGAQRASPRRREPNRPATKSAARGHSRALHPVRRR